MFEDLKNKANKILESLGSKKWKNGKVLKEAGIKEIKDKDGIL